MERKLLQELSKRLIHPAVFDTIREPLLILDPCLEVVAANAAFYTDFDESSADVIGRPIFSLGDGQWNIPSLRELLEQVLPRDNEFNGFQVDHDFPSIGRRIFHLNARGIVTDTSNPRLVLLAFEDITAKVWADRRLKNKSEKLERSNVALEQFSNIAAHDLQSPLNRISIFMNLLSESASDRLTDNEKDYVAKVQTQARRMRMLMQDLLMFAKVAEHELPVEEVDLQLIVHDTINTLQQEITAAHANIVATNLPVVKARKFQFLQMFHNLIENSLKYRKKEVAPVVKVTGIVGDGGNFVLSISDNGIGFKPEEAEMIFEPFRRLHGNSGEYTGTGMGLAICHRVVESHGGAICAAGSPSEGATFTVSFPPGFVAETQANQSHG